MEIEHGTYAGAQVHQKRGEPLTKGNSVCEPCRLARNDYISMWRRHTEAPSEVAAKKQRRAEVRARRRVAAAHPEEYQRYYAEELERISRE